MANSTRTRSSGFPEYRKIERDLRKDIQAGQWAVGAMIPSRRDLAKQYFVSLLTVSRAIEPLLADGTLRTDKRRGTFIARRIAPASHDVQSSAAIAPLTPRAVSPVTPQGIIASPIALGNVGVVTYILHSFFPEYHILHTLEQLFSKVGDRVTVFNRNRGVGIPPLDLTDGIEMALNSNLDALVIVCLDRDVSLIEIDLADPRLNNLPVVCILPGEINRPIPHVFYDNRSGGYQAAQHLIGKGIRELTIVSPFTARWVSERVAGIRTAASDANIGEAFVQYITGENRPWQILSDPRPIAYQAAKTAIRKGWRPAGGILCVSDGVAFGVIDAAAELGLTPGIDFAIVGFDDGPEAREIDLTSVRPPMDAMAREAVRLLYDHKRGIDMSLQIRLGAHVIPRGSSDLKTETVRLPDTSSP